MLSTKPVAHAREKTFDLTGGDIVPHRDAREYEELVQEPPYRYALPLRRVPYLAHGDAQREGLEDRRKAEHEKADPDRAELVRKREALVGLVHREHAAAKEEEQRDDQRPEVALLPVSEWMARRCRSHASTDADIKKDLIHGVRDRVRRLREKRPRPCHESRDRLDDRDRQVAGESRDDGARRSLGHYQPSSRSGPGSGWIVRSVRATADSPTVSAFPSQSAGVRDPPMRASSALPSVS